jgi:putative membrane protein
MENSQSPADDLTGCDQLNPLNQLDQPKQLEQSQSPNPSELPAESRTREYLSNERTYLAWMRTAVSLMGVGVILGRIHAARLPLASRPKATWQLGIVFAVVGLITVFLATQHYLAVRREIADDSTEITERWVIVFSIAVLLIGSGIVYYGLTL